MISWQAKRSSAMSHTHKFRILVTFRSVSPGLMSFCKRALMSTEKLANPSEVQSEPHLPWPLDVVLGQLAWLLNRLAWRTAKSILKLTIVGGQALFTHGWFLEPIPSAPLM